MHQVVDGAIKTKPERMAEEQGPYDMSRFDFDKLKKEFERNPAKRTTVQTLKQAIENRLRRLLEQNPLRTDFQQHYETEELCRRLKYFPEYGHGRIHILSGDPVVGYRAQAMGTHRVHSHTGFLQLLGRLV